MTLRLGLAGDTMLGRGVAAQIGSRPHPPALFSPDVVAAAHEADLLLLNLECAVSARGQRWPDPGKAFFFRAPPSAVDVLVTLGVDCVTLANNHALDYGYDALLDTLDHLAAAGIATVGAGSDIAAAQRPTIVERDGFRVGVLGVTDHPSSYAAAPDRPGVAYAELSRGVPGWLTDAVRGLATPSAATGVDLALVTPHWGPNMVPSPLAYVRAAARSLRGAGAGLVAGHSAHVFHGVEDAVCYDLGDFVDDYATDPMLRNDLGVLLLVDVDEHGPRRLEAVPLHLDYCHTEMAHGEDAAWVRDRFRRACAALGTEVGEEDGRLTVAWPREDVGRVAETLGPNDLLDTHRDSGHGDDRSSGFPRGPGHRPR